MPDLQLYWKEELNKIIKNEVKKERVYSFYEKTPQR